MAKSFAITTTATDVLRADAKGHTETGFTVTNTTSRPIRGLAKVKPLGDTKREWLSIQGEAERDFAPGATQQFTVSFDGPPSEPPAATPPGSASPPTGAPTSPARKYPFRLDVESALNPDEDFTEGPTVTVEMAAAAVTPKKKFPLWILFVILGALLLIGVIVLVVVLATGDKEETVTEETPTPSPEETVSPSPSPEEKPSPTESIAQQCFKFAQARNQNLSPVQVRTLCRGASNPEAPGECARRAMTIRTSTLLRARVTPDNAVSLCRGTDNADRVIACFQPKITQKMSVAQAITACRPKE